METAVQQVKPLVEMDRSSRRSYKDSDGNKLPGVTTVLGILNKPMLLPWAAKEERIGLLECFKNGTKVPEKYFYNTKSTNAADVGTICHFMCECYLKNQEPNLTKFPKEQVELARNGFNKFIVFWEREKLKVIHTELQLIDPYLSYGGSIDIICQDANGKLIILDLKTSRAIYSDMWSQVAAYSSLWAANNPSKIERHIIVRIGKEKADDLEVEENNNLDVYWTIFGGALMIYNAQKKIKDL